MGLRTYDFKIQGYDVKIKAKKDTAERIASRLNYAGKTPSYVREINGVVGGESRESILWVMFSAPDPPMDEETKAKWLVATAQFYTDLPDLITMENCQEWIDKSTAIRDKYMVVHDKRRTEEEIEERNKVCADNREQWAQDKENWLMKYCGSTEPVKIPEGQMGVVLRFYYNDSDMMTDYYHPHCGWGHTMLLGTVKKGPRRESTARSVLSKYPELAALTWKWNVQNWSMGHGNWLESKEMITRAVGKKTYSGISDPQVWYEISLSSYGDIYPYKPFLIPPGKVATTETPQEKNIDLDFEVTHDRDWTWIEFPEKPADSILKTLKENFQAGWSPRRKAWFIRSITDRSTLENAFMRLTQ